MLKKKCSACARKVGKKFNYCPYCGASFGGVGVSDEFGMLGRSDSGERVQEELKLPFGLNGIMNSLIKQLEGQLGNMDFGDGQGMPKGIKIRVARGPQMGQVVQRAPGKKVVNVVEVSDKERARRMGLSRVDAESRMKRLGDSIIYEIEAPGVKNKEDVVLTELATGLEIKAYSGDKCYVKVIPLKVEVAHYDVKHDKVFVEIKA